jgi:hypothetical protein
MTRKKAPAKSAAGKKPAARKAAILKMPARKPKSVSAFVVVREILGETTTYTEPERAFATQAAARAFAEERNRELRQLVNPFEMYGPDSTAKGGEKALLELVKKLKLPGPKKATRYGYARLEWEKWWDAHYFDMTDAQRDAVWDALEKYNWYKVKPTTLE